MRFSCLAIMTAPALPTYAPVADGDFDAHGRAARPGHAAQPGAARPLRPERSRRRLRAGFAPERMRWICLGGERVGFYSSSPRTRRGAWIIYLRADAQGRGWAARCCGTLSRRRAACRCARRRCATASPTPSTASAALRADGRVGMGHRIRLSRRQPALTSRPHTPMRSAISVVPRQPSRS